jgi:hypothetical protein
MRLTAEFLIYEALAMTSKRNQRVEASGVTALFRRLGRETPKAAAIGTKTDTVRDRKKHGRICPFFLRWCDERQRIRESKST